MSFNHHQYYYIIIIPAGTSDIVKTITAMSSPHCMLSKKTRWCLGRHIGVCRSSMMYWDVDVLSHEKNVKIISFSPLLHFLSSIALNRLHTCINMYIYACVCIYTRATYIYFVRMIRVTPHIDRRGPAWCNVINITDRIIDFIPFIWEHFHCMQLKIVAFYYAVVYDNFRSMEVIVYLYFATQIFASSIFDELYINCSRLSVRYHHWKTEVYKNIQV